MVRLHDSLIPAIAPFVSIYDIPSLCSVARAYNLESWSCWEELRIADGREQVHRADADCTLHDWNRLPQRIRQSISAGVRRLVLMVCNPLRMLQDWRHGLVHEFCMLETLTVLPIGRLQPNLMRDDNLLMSHTSRQEKCENDTQNVLQSDAPSLDSLKAVLGRLGTVWGRLGTVWGSLFGLSFVGLGAVLARSWAVL